jgi:hypothetical protein
VDYQSKLDLGDDVPSSSPSKPRRLLGVDAGSDTDFATVAESGPDEDYSDDPKTIAADLHPQTSKEPNRSGIKNGAASTQVKQGMINLKISTNRDFLKQKLYIQNSAKFKKIAALYKHKSLSKKKSASQQKVIVLKIGKKHKTISQMA